MIPLRLLLQLLPVQNNDDDDWWFLVLLSCCQPVCLCLWCCCGCCWLSGGWGGSWLPPLQLLRCSGRWSGSCSEDIIYLEVLLSSIIYHWLFSGGWGGSCNDNFSFSCASLVLRINRCSTSLTLPPVRCYPSKTPVENIIRTMHTIEICKKSCKSDIACSPPFSYQPASSSLWKNLFCDHVLFITAHNVLLPRQLLVRFHKNESFL